MLKLKIGTKTIQSTIFEINQFHRFGFGLFFPDFLRFYPRFTLLWKSIWLDLDIVPISLSRRFSLVKTNFWALKVELKESSFSSNQFGICTENAAYQM